MGIVLTYHSALCHAMMIASEHPRAIVMGQAVAVPGTTMSSTFRDVPMEKRLEMPVAEDMQMGMATGMALAGYRPVCVFPRWNFLLCAANQLVNHLDRLPLYSRGGYRPKVIIRTAVPSKSPFNPGPQHDDDFTEAFRMMFRTINVFVLHEVEEILPAYRESLKSDTSSLLVEFTDAYRNARAEETAQVKETV